METDQRYTPGWVWALAEDCLSKVDLDPTATPDLAHHRATVNITEQQDCFTTPWGSPATVWMNPPYSNSAGFLQAFADHQRRIGFRGITLTLPGVLSNKGTAPILKGAIASGGLTAACFPTGRIQFVNSGRANDRDSLFLYWGSGREEFRRVFGAVGIVVEFQP